MKSPEMLFGQSRSEVSELNNLPKDWRFPAHNRHSLCAGKLAKACSSSAKVKSHYLLQA